MNEKNISFKKRPLKSKDEVKYEHDEMFGTLYTMLKVIINFLILIGFGYFLFAKVLPSLTYEIFDKYDTKERTTLVNVNKITFDRDDVPYANSYYEALTNYNEQKDSKFINQLKDDINNGSCSSTRFRLEQIDYDDVYYSANKINKIEYSKDVKEPKIKLIYEDKYYKTNNEGEKGQIAKKAKWPEKETTLVLPKEDDN